MLAYAPAPGCALPLPAPDAIAARRAEMTGGNAENDVPKAKKKKRKKNIEKSEEKKMVMKKKTTSVALLYQ